MKQICQLQCGVRWFILIAKIERRDAVVVNGVTVYYSIIS